MARQKIIKRIRAAALLIGMVMIMGGCIQQPTDVSVTPSPESTIPAAPPTDTPLPVSPATLQPGKIDASSLGEPLPWWNDSVFYEIFVRSFFDSNGDGIGDFNGLTAKLDYLNDGNPDTNDDLGITGIWLMPIHPSPSYHGYDVTDYRAVNPQYGTMEDFQRFLDEAHRRGIRVIIDLVLNHSSDQHPWFESAAADPASPYRGYYIWSAQDPAYRGPDGQNVWHASGRGDFYYGLFWSGMPDLNYANPAATAEMQDVARFWLEEVGVDGFRLDAARHLVEEGKDQLNTQATLDWWRGFREFYKGVNPQAMTVGEIWDKTDQVARYTQGDALDLAFDFDLASGFIVSAAGKDARPVRTILKRDMQAFKPGQFATFLTNHDQNRAMDQFNREFPRAKMAAALLLTSPGVPFIYYGEEIGMTGVKPDERIRTPMQWSAEAGAGFTTGQPWEELNQGFDLVNVAEQSAQVDSLLSTYRDLIHLRNSQPALRSANAWFLETGDQGVYAVLRVSPEQALLVVINLRSEPVSEYTLSLESSPLSGNFNVSPIFGGSLPENETILFSAEGAFDGFVPLSELPANAILVFELE